MDAADYEVSQAIKFGADVITILGVAEDASIKAAIEEAHKRVVIRNRGPLRKMDSVDQMHKDQYKLNEFLHRLNTIPTHFIDAEGSQVEVTNRIVNILQGYLSGKGYRKTI